MHTEDKEKMYKSFQGMRSSFALDVISLFKAGEEISLKELSERSKAINSGHSYNKNAINGVLNKELKDKVESCGKNKWRLINKG